MTDSCTNIAEHLTRRAASNPDLLAVAIPGDSDQQGRCSYDEYTFKTFNELTDVYARGLSDLGISGGDRCVLMVKPSLDFFALSFAILRLGAVLVCIDPGMGLRHMKTCLRDAEPDAFIGIGKAHLARWLLRWPAVKHAVLVSDSNRHTRFGMHTSAGIRARGKAAAETEWPTVKDAAILFTSGSTGVPKGVVYEHRHFLAQIDALRDLFQIQVGERDLCTFPLFALFAPALGMSSIIPDMDFTRPGSVNPLHVLTPVQERQVTNMFGSPALLKQVARYGLQHDSAMPSLKRVISAGAPANNQTLEDFSKMPGEETQIFTPYGATESLPVSNIGSKELLSQHRQATNDGKGVCVGKPAPGMEVRIIAISDEAVLAWHRSLEQPRGRIGEICVRGPVVTERYYMRPQETHLAKIPDERGLFHRMGDLGYVDEQGRLWFCGRKAHRVKTADTCFYTIPCEAVFNTHAAVERTALIPLQIDKQVVPGLCIERSAEAGINDHQLLKELHAIGRQHSHTAAITHFFFHPGFPVDIRHNAKINREELAQWAARQQALQP